MDTKTNNPKLEEVGGRIVRITLKEALKPTQKQLKIVENIEETLSVKFTGKTKEDARKFIDTHMDAYITAYNLECELYALAHDYENAGDRE